MEKKKKEERIITEEMFRNYELVRQSGLYNMLDPNAVVMSGLERLDYWHILDNYGKFLDKYGDEYGHTV